MPTTFIFGTVQNDVLTGGDERDPAVAWDEIFHGFGGMDVIRGGGGHDWIWASTADKTSGVFFYGGSGDDVLVSFGGSDWLQGDEGNDILIAGDGGGTFLGGAGDDQIWAGFGENSANGGVGADLLVTGDGLDTLIAGRDAERDVLIGGAGRDNHIVAGGGAWTSHDLADPQPDPGLAGVNLIWGFVPGEDVLTLPHADVVGFAPFSGATNDFVATSGYFAELGLSGTLIELQTADAPAMTGAVSAWIFLAGVDVTMAALLTTGSLGYNSVILDW